MLIIYLLLVLPILSQFEDMSPIIDLTDNDFQASVWGHKYLLVYFYAPWCKHCENFTPKYELIAKTLFKEFPEVAITRIDCDQNRKIAKQEKVNSFPTIKLYIDEKEHIYQGLNQQIQGDRELEDVIGWIFRKTKPPNTQLLDVLDLAQIQTNKEINFILFIDEEEDQQILNLYTRLCFDYTDSAIFYHTNNEQIREKFQITKSIHLIVIRNSDESRVDFEKDFTQENMIDFFRNESGDWIMDWTQDAAERIFGHLIDTLFFVKGFDEQLNEKYLEFIKSMNLKGSLFVCVVNFDKYANEIRELLQIQQQDQPKIVILKSNLNDHQQIVFNNELNEQNIKNFIVDFQTNQIKNNINDNQIKQEGQVLLFNDQELQTFLVENDYNILVYYSNQQCQDFDLQYRELAQKLQDQQKLKFVKIDDKESGDCKQKLYLYLRNNKDQPLKYFNNQRSIENIAKFIEDNIQNDWISQNQEFQNKDYSEL